MAHTTSTEQCQYCNVLSKGSKVEVWSEEDGFHNAWFSAEILHPPLSAHSPSGRKRKKTATAVVKYDHMLSPDGDGDGDGGPLIERINTCFIRPAPPLDSMPDRPFELNEVVDAFFQDTWWTGFVVRVVNDTYTVAFKKPLDLQEHRRSDLRRHWDWVDSKWVRPDKEDTTGMIYIPGTEVEVNRHDESPCHAWLQAVIIGQVESTSFLVRYKSSDSGDESLKQETVQETVDLEQIRPLPPEMDAENFDVLEKVNVFRNSCWWVGVITKILEGNRYIVTLRHKKAMEFSHSELRPHFEWIGGQWVSKSKGLLLTSDCQEQIRPTLDQSSGVLDDTEKERLCSSNKQDDQKIWSPCVEKAPYLGGSNVEKRGPVSSGDKPVEVIRNGDDKITKQKKVGEMENQAVTSAKKRGGQRKSRESSGSILDDAEKERPRSIEKQDKEKELTSLVENSNLEKENHVSSSDKPAEVNPNGDHEITKQQAVGETEHQPVTPARKRGRRRKSLESTGSIFDDTEKERPFWGKKQGNRKELSPRVEKLHYLGSSNLENKNQTSSSDKAAEAIPNGDDKMTRQQEVGDMEKRADTLADKRKGRPRKCHESSGSTLADTEKERCCSGNKQANRKNFGLRVEKWPYLGSSNMEKEDHIPSGDKPAEVIPNEHDKKTRQEEAGETDNQVDVSAKKRGRLRKSHESSGSTLDDTEKDRPCASKILDSQKELTPCVEKLLCIGTLIMEKENHITSGGKPVEVIRNGDDKKTRQEIAGEMENQAVISAKKRGRLRKSRESSGSTLDDAEKERPCSSEKLGNKKELTPCVEQSPYFGNSSVKKENHISSVVKPVEVIQTADDKKTKKQESGEMEILAILSSKKVGRQRKSCESSGSMDDENNRPSLCNKEDNQRELSPCVEKSTCFGSLNMEKENDVSSSDKPVEVTQHGDDKKTKQQEAGETENQTVISSKKRGRSKKQEPEETENRTVISSEKRGRSKKQEAVETENQTVISSKKRGRSKKSEPNDSWATKRRREGPSRLKIRESQSSSTVEGTSIEAADTKHLETMKEKLEVCHDMSKDFEGIKGARVENSCQPPIVEGHVERSSEITEKGEHPELPVANLQAAVAGVELCEVGGFAADCTTEKSKSSANTEMLLTDPLEKDGTTLGPPTPIIVSSNDQDLSLPVEETQAPTNAGKSVGTASTGVIVRTDVQHLPFVKCYPVWQMIESMEVFKKLPQNPHFQPLMKCKEVKREGLAIGHMMNFASLVEKTFKLEENDCREDFESILEELIELEELGFDVEVVRGRVSELRRAKFMLENFKDKLSGVEIEIREHSDAKAKIDGEVADIDKELKRLEEKRAVLMLESEDTDSKLAKLNSEARAIGEGISSTRESFRSLVETPW